MRPAINCYTQNIALVLEPRHTQHSRKLVADMLLEGCKWRFQHPLAPYQVLLPAREPATRYIEIRRQSQDNGFIRRTRGAVVTHFQGCLQADAGKEATWRCYTGNSGSNE